MEKYIAVAIGGAVGALCRMALGEWVMTKVSSFPYGTVVVSIWNGCSKPHWLPYYWPCTRSIYAKARFIAVGEVLPRGWWTWCIYNIFNLCL